MKIGVRKSSGKRLAVKIVRSLTAVLSRSSIGKEIPLDFFA